MFQMFQMKIFKNMKCDGESLDCEFGYQLFIFSPKTRIKRILTFCIIVLSCEKTTAFKVSFRLF
jgi:hypothetical protein